MINKKLLKRAFGVKYYFIAVAAGGTGIVLLSVFWASLLSKILDGVLLKSMALEKVWAWLVMLISFVFLRAGIIWINEILSKNCALKIKHDLRMEIQESIFAAGPVKLKGKKAGEVVNLAVEGVEALDPYFSEYLPQLALALITPLIILIYVFPTDLLSALIMLFTAPLIPIFMILIGKWASNTHDRQWEALNRLGGHFLDVVRGLSTLKLFGRSKSQSNVIYRMSERFRSTTLRVLRIALLSAFTLELIATLSTAVIAVALGLRLLYGKIEFEAAIFVLLLIPDFYQSLRQLGAKYHSGMAGNTAAEKIFSFLDAYKVDGNKREKTKELEINKSGDMEILVSEVSFRYDVDREPAVDNITFFLKKGEFTVLTGHSGCGKSTIMSLVMRFLEQETGTISVNGIDIGIFNIEAWRRQIAFVPQQTYLFKGTIEDNLRLAKHDAAEIEIIAAAEQSGANEFINNLPQGYKTAIDEGGFGLSGGQKQLLSITRAFLKDSPVVLMDEPTSNLDIDMETRVIEAIEKLIPDKIVLLISHHPYLIKKADRILHMKEGRIVEDVLTMGFSKEGESS